MRNQLLEKSRNKTGSKLNKLIIESIQEKKGEEIVVLNLSAINEAITDYFIICHAPSTVQVKAIADHISEKVQSNLGEKPWHCEGIQSAEWVLLDYISTVVHVFLQEKRDFYQLEELWSDAEIKKIASD